MDKAKHIVIDARNRRSSTGRYTDRLVKHLQKVDKKNRYTILVEAGDIWKPHNQNFKTRTASFQQFSFNPIDQIAFARLLYSLKPDVVHFMMTQQPLFYFGNIVTTTHDLTMFKYTRPSRFPVWLHKIGLLLYRFLFWWSHKKSKKIIVPSKFVAKDMTAYQPLTKDKLAVTYEASDPPIKAKPMAVKGIIKPFILHVGAPLPHKNLDRLILAFDEVKKTQPILQLVLAGKMKDQFKKDMRKWLNASPNNADVITPGYVNDAELKWLYENAEMYVLPSLSEGFGLPGLEAMAHNCPVIASDNTCLPEIYGEAALYFNPFEAQEIAVEIEKVLTSDKLKKRLIAAGRLRLKKYSWDILAKETLNVYNNAYAKKNKKLKEK